ncbi:LPP20 family lipoprotein [Candidatus Sulfurimonas marisnigri]|uniref:LPP20 family lipoprotein n=1 Tax=Candidatus Sulfurimonas marisnigri TaxID=2740405 RepID=A0A7S7M1G7_9BACT|nr:LPP20 family lipoprotein [Candidatus Sulfurimonas marisnigri]QOY55382.1 LPP20 family lipoprotein [Candidatus Sulfurimonas marisnigri]
MRIFTNILLALLAVTFIGCSAGKAPQALHVEKQLPKWYLTPPSNNGISLYGVGEGINREESIKSALDNLVSKLGITISSNYNSTTNTKKGYREYFTQASSSDISSEVSKIRISNYEVIEIHKQNYKHFITLVRSDKKLFIKNLITTLNQRYKKIEDKQKHIIDMNILRRYSFFKESQQTLSQTHSTLLVLNSLDKNFDDSPYLKIIQTINNDSDLLIKNMSISFSASKESSAFVNSIKSVLSETKIAIKPNSQNDKNNINISLSHKLNKAFSHGFHIARTSVLIEVKDNKKNIMHSEQIDAVGHSPQSDDIAMSDSIKNFKEEIEKRDVLKILGVN